MNYKDFELQISKEAPNLYGGSALDNDNIVAAQTFELRTGELKVIEGLHRLEEKAISAKDKDNRLSQI